MSMPNPGKRREIEGLLDDLITAIEDHELWTVPSPNQTLYYVWDFINRSKYMLSEFESIQSGAALKHPDQFRPSPGTGDQAALKVFNDVCGRTMMLKMLVSDTTGRTAMLTSGRPASIDFGPVCKAKVEELLKACPKTNLSAGLKQ